MTSLYIPKISIILCTYNRRAVVQRAIRSVLGQTFSEWQLLIIDDGSTDGSEMDLAPLALKDRRIIYIKTQNQKLARARNLGIRLAEAPLITFIDSDDRYGRRHLELRYDYLQKNPEVDVIHGGVRLIGPKEFHWVVDAFDRSQRIHISDCCMGATLFGKKNAFEKVNGFRVVPYSSESDLLKRMPGVVKVRKVAFPTYYYYLKGEDRICRNVDMIDSLANV